MLILADDLGWSDLGAYGNRLIDTPHLDELAEDGVRFTNAYAAAPVCAPTRASILTGLYPARLGMPMLTRPHRRPWAKLIPPPNAHALSPQTTSLAPELAGAGYVSTLIGKWHLGYGNHPHDLEAVRMPPGLGPKTEAVSFGFERAPTGRIVAERDDPAGRFARSNPFKGVGRQTAQAVEFLESRGDQPFFLFLSYSTVHIPMEAREELVHKYRKRLGDTPSKIDPRYAAMVETMDESVGIVLSTLERLELDSNTVVVFFSDNGGLVRVYHGEGPLVTTNAPLRDEKGSLYEGGIRVPLIVRWPGRAEPRVENEPVISTDLLPTFLNLAGLHEPENYPGDGVSLRTLLESGSPLDREALYWHYPAYHHSTPASAIRKGRHKLIEFFEDQRVELYDLIEDPGETYDLAEDEPAPAGSLLRELRTWRAETGAKEPTLNPAYDPDREGVWGVRPQFPWGEVPAAPLEIRRVE